MLLVEINGLLPMSRVSLHPQVLCALKLPSLLEAWLQQSRVDASCMGEHRACTSARLLHARVPSLAPSTSPSLCFGDCLVL